MQQEGGATTEGGGTSGEEALPAVLPAQPCWRHSAVSLVWLSSVGTCHVPWLLWVTRQSGSLSRLVSPRCIDSGDLRESVGLPPGTALKGKYGDSGRSTATRVHLVSCHPCTVSSGQVTMSSHSFIQMLRLRHIQAQSQEPRQP